MRYKKFIIRNYTAITGPLEIDIAKDSLIPIIGVNECGKTTILHAIFSFDYNNDSLNSGGRHLQDTSNLYSLNHNAPNPRITAEIEISRNEFKELFKAVDKANPTVSPSATETYFKPRRQFPEITIITRDLKTIRINLN